jgi:hypothetical protein
MLASGGTRTPSSAQSLQWCVNRWNQLKIDWLSAQTIAIVASRPCFIKFADAGDWWSGRGSCPGDAPNYRFPPGVPKVCAVFPCAINHYGAYQCWIHASNTVGATRHWNAFVTRTGELVLDHPPTNNVRTPLPSWAAGYPHDNGYIIPWTKGGQLRHGLRLGGTSREASCIQQSDEVAAATALTCDRHDLLYDPCFAAKPGLEKDSITERPGIVACAMAPGSTSFIRIKSNGRFPP